MKMKIKFLSIVLSFFLIIHFLLVGCSKDEYLQKLTDNDYRSLNRLEEYETEEIIRVYETKKDEIVQVVRVPAYEDPMEFIFEIDGEFISNVVLLQENETEDYGGYVKEEWFLKRLYLPIDNEIEVVKMSKEKENQVVAITGATITSEAAVYGLNKCIENYRGIKK